MDYFDFKIIKVIFDSVIIVIIVIIVIVVIAYILIGLFDSFVNDFKVNCLISFTSFKIYVSILSFLYIQILKLFSFLLGT